MITEIPQRITCRCSTKTEIPDDRAAPPRAGTAHDPHGHHAPLKPRRYRGDLGPGQPPRADEAGRA